MTSKNPRNAGRKPGPFLKTSVKATVPNELILIKKWEQIKNKQAFVRAAIAEKLAKE